MRRIDEAATRLIMEEDCTRRRCRRQGLAKNKSGEKRRAQSVLCPFTFPELTASGSSADPLSGSGPCLSLRTALRLWHCLRFLHVSAEQEHRSTDSTSLKRRQNVTRQQLNRLLSFAAEPLEKKALPPAYQP